MHKYPNAGVLQLGKNGNFLDCDMEKIKDFYFFSSKCNINCPEKSIFH